MSEMKVIQGRLRPGKQLPSDARPEGDFAGYGTTDKGYAVPLMITRDGILHAAEEVNLNISFRSA